MKLPSKSQNFVKSDKDMEIIIQRRGVHDEDRPQPLGNAVAALPDDVLCHLVGSGRLNPPDLVRMERVSKSFQAIVASESVWRLVAPKATRKQSWAAEEPQYLKGLGQTARAFHQRMRNKTAEEKSMFRRAYDEGVRFPLSHITILLQLNRTDPRRTVFFDDFDFMRAAAAGDQEGFSDKNILMAVSRRLKADLAFSLSLLLLSKNHEIQKSQGFGPGYQLGYRAGNNLNGPIDFAFPRIHLYVGEFGGIRINLMATRTRDNQATRRLFKENWPLDKQGGFADVRFYEAVGQGQDQEFFQELSAKLQGTKWARDLSLELTVKLLRIGYDSYEKLEVLMRSADQGTDLSSFDNCKNPSPWKKILFTALGSSEPQKVHLSS